MARASGAVAEWLGRGLQSLAHQVDSGRRLTVAKSGPLRGHDDFATFRAADGLRLRPRRAEPAAAASCALDGTAAAEGEHVCDEDLRLTNRTAFPYRRRALVPGGECLTLVTSELA